MIGKQGGGHWTYDLGFEIPQSWNRLFKTS